MAIMREVGVSKTTVWRWQKYFAEAGVEGLVKGRSKPRSETVHMDRTAKTILVKHRRAKKVLAKTRCK